MSDTGLDFIATANTYARDARLDTVQRETIYTNDEDLAGRFVKYLRGLGFTVFVPSDCNEPGWSIQIDFLITRETIADTRKGDAIAFDGRYEVRGG